MSHENKKRDWKMSKYIFGFKFLSAFKKTFIYIV